MGDYCDIIFNGLTKKGDETQKNNIQLADKRQRICLIPGCFLADDVEKAHLPSHVFVPHTGLCPRDDRNTYAVDSRLYFQGVSHDK
jgi:hypothetical protein